MINSLTRIGLVGFQAGQQGMIKAANDIASAANFNLSSSDQVPQRDTPDLVESIVELKESRLQSEASLEVIAVSDDMLGRLLDILV